MKKTGGLIDFDEQLLIDKHEIGALQLQNSEREQATFQLESRALLIVSGNSCFHCWITAKTCRGKVCASVPL